ncbi:MAG: ArnT family glycosyltransferase [Deltaproteobacteria bacterium]
MGNFFVSAALFLLSFCVRFALIGKGAYHYDVAELILAVQRSIDGQGMQYMHGAGYPLHVLIASLFIRVFQPPVFAVNFMAVLAGSLSVPLLFEAVRKLIDSRTALFSALLFSVFPAFLSASVYGINNSVSVLFALASFVFMIDAVSSGKRSLFLVSGILFGCCVSVRLPDALFILPLSALVFLYKKTYARADISFFLVPWILIPAACYAPLMAHGGVGSILDALTSQTQGKFGGIVSPVFGLSLGWLNDMLTVPGIALAGAGAWLLYRNRLFPVLLIWFLVFFLYYGNVLTVEPRMLIMAGIPALVLAGYSLARLYQPHRLTAVVLAVLTGTFMLAPLLPVLWFRHQHAQIQEYFTWLASETEPGSAVIATDNGIFLELYARGRVHLSHPDTCDRQRMLDFFSREVDPRLDAGIPVYLISSAFQYDGCDMFRKTLEERYELVFKGSHQNEDWHHHCLTAGVYDDPLVKIESKGGDINGDRSSGGGTCRADSGMGAAGARESGPTADNGH